MGRKQVGERTYLRLALQTAESDILGAIRQLEAGRGNPQRINIACALKLLQCRVKAIDETLRTKTFPDGSKAEGPIREE